MRSIHAAFAALVLLAACTTAPITTTPRIGPDGQPLPTVYRISASDEDRIKIRMQDSINALRRSSGLPELNLDAKLIAAAATHSRDMSVQNRPWNFGSDGSSPLDRIARVGYAGGLVGENIRETYETELETLSAWMEEPGPRAVILDPRARNMGFDWFQEPNGKLWWTLILGS